MVLSIVVILAAIATGVWWFYFRTEAVTDAITADPTIMVGKIYGNSNITVMYEFVDSFNVKILQVNNQCSYSTWSMKTSTTIDIVGKGVFTLSADKASLTSSSGEVFTQFIGDMSMYCELIGKNV